MPQRHAAQHPSGPRLLAQAETLPPAAGIRAFSVAVTRTLAATSSCCPHRRPWNKAEKDQVRAGSLAVWKALAILVRLGRLRVGQQQLAQRVVALQVPHNGPRCRQNARMGCLRRVLPRKLHGRRLCSPDLMSRLNFGRVCARMPAWAVCVETSPASCMVGACAALLRSTGSWLPQPLLGLSAESASPRAAVTAPVGFRV